MINLNIESIKENSQEEVVKTLNLILPLEEDEVVLDYRYIEGEDLEIFSEIGEIYYRRFYGIADNKIEKTSEEVIELGKGGLKIKE